MPVNSADDQAMRLLREGPAFALGEGVVVQTPPSTKQELRGRAPRFVNGVDLTDDNIGTELERQARAAELRVANGLPAAALRSVDADANLGGVVENRFKAIVQLDKAVYRRGDTLLCRAWILHAFTNTPICGDAQPHEVSDLFGHNATLALTNSQGVNVAHVAVKAITCSTVAASVQLGADIAPGKYVACLRFEPCLPLDGAPDPSCNIAPGARAFYVQSDDTSPSAEPTKMADAMPVLKAYPEGGQLVPGVASSVYVEARDASGAPLEASGSLFPDSTKRTPSQLNPFPFTTDATGRARVLFTLPENAAGPPVVTIGEGGSKAEAIVAADGFLAEGPAGLPTASIVAEAGVIAPGAPLALDVAASAAGKYLVAAFRLEVLITFEVVALEKCTPKKVTLRFGDSDPCGLLRLTVFAVNASATKTNSTSWDASARSIVAAIAGSSAGHKVLLPVAERLIFRFPPPAKTDAVALSVGLLQSKFHPQEQIRFTVGAPASLTEPAVISAAITDIAALTQLTDHQPMLLSAMLLDTDIADVPDLDRLAMLGYAEDLDRALGCQGWRRFVHFMPDAAGCILPGNKSLPERRALHVDYTTADPDDGPAAEVVHSSQKELNDWIEQRRIDEQNVRRREPTNGAGLKVLLDRITSAFSLDVDDAEKARRKELLCPFFSTSADGVRTAVAKRAADLTKLRVHGMTVLQLITAFIEDTAGCQVLCAAIDGSSELKKLVDEPQQAAQLFKRRGLSCAENTPLIEAALRGKAAMVAALLDHGADLARRNAHFQSPLDAACASGSPDTISAVLKKLQSTGLAVVDKRHCTLLAPSETGFTPLHWAALSPNPAAALGAIAAHAESAGAPISKDDAAPTTTEMKYTPAAVAARIHGREVKTGVFAAAADSCDARGYTAAQLRALHNAEEVLRSSSTPRSLAPIIDPYGRWSYLAPPTVSVKLAGAVGVAKPLDAALQARPDMPVVELLRAAAEAAGWGTSLPLEDLALIPVAAASADRAVPSAATICAWEEPVALRVLVGPEAGDAGVLTFPKEVTFAATMEDAIRRHTGMFVVRVVDGVTASGDASLLGCPAVAAVVRTRNFAAAAAWGPHRVPLDATPASLGLDNGDAVFVHCPVLHSAGPAALAAPTRAARLGDVLGWGPEFERHCPPELIVARRSLPNGTAVKFVFPSGASLSLDLGVLGVNIEDPVARLADALRGHEAFVEKCGIAVGSGAALDLSMAIEVDCSEAGKRIARPVPHGASVAYLFASLARSGGAGAVKVSATALSFAPTVSIVPKYFALLGKLEERSGKFISEELLEDEDYWKYYAPPEFRCDKDVREVRLARAAKKLAALKSRFEKPVEDAMKDGVLTERSPDLDKLSVEFDEFIEGLHADDDDDWWNDDGDAPSSEQPTKAPAEVAVPEQPPAGRRELDPAFKARPPRHAIPDGGWGALRVVRVYSHARLPRFKGKDVTERDDVQDTLLWTSGALLRPADGAPLSFSCATTDVSSMYRLLVEGVTTSGKYCRGVARIVVAE